MSIIRRTLSRANSSSTKSSSSIKSSALNSSYIASVGELQRKNHYIIDIPGLSSSVTLLCTNFPLPKVSTDVIEVRHGNDVTKLAGQSKFDGGDVSFVDSIDLDTDKALSDWYSKVYDAKTGKMGKASDYRVNATVTVVAPDGTLGRRYRLINLWPSSYDPDSLDSESADIKKIKISLVWDRGYRI